MGNSREEEIEIDLRELFLELKERALVIVAAGLLLGWFASVFTVFLMAPVYTSTSSILVITKETTLASLADLQMGSQLTNDYEVLITSRPVLEKVIGNLGLDMDYKELREKITIQNPTDTRILEIAVEDSEPEAAQRIVRELTGIASEFIGDKMEVVPPKVIEEGELPTEKTSPNVIRHAVIGILAGIILSAGVIVSMIVLDDTIKSEDDIERYLEIPTLASIPDRKDYIGGKKKSRRKREQKKKKAGGKNR